MTEVYPVHRTEHATLDIVFIHGLDGDSRRTWSRAERESFWPLWLAEDISDASVWTVSYDAWSSRWRGAAMGMQDRSINLLAQLQNHGIGDRPLCFVTHSMGGLIAKEMLMHAAEGQTEYRSFATAAKGIVFLATPHTGSGLTMAVDALGVLYRGTPAVRDLRRNSGYLRHLNDRYRDWVDSVGTKNLVFFESRATRGVRVVDAASANPGLAHVRPIAVDADHIDICKPLNRNSLVYGQIVRFAKTLVAAIAHPETPQPSAIVRRPDEVSRPYDVILPSVGPLNWAALLDGSPLTGNFETAGVMERTVMFDGTHLDPAAMLEWLRLHPGRTVFLTGDRGDGKTSYINLLAAQSVGSHYFLRWAHDVPFSIRLAEQCAMEIQDDRVSETNVVVIVYPISSNGSSALLEALAGELSAGSSRSDRRAVVVVEGDDGTFERLPFYTAHSMRLIPPGPESAPSWAALIERAYQELRHAGDNEQQIVNRYPNLPQFVRSRPAEQQFVLADSQSPMIVRLLRAVYGPDLWGRLFDELLRLRPPSPDAISYLHVCLASVAGRGIPTHLLDSLQPEAQSEQRSMRDPWTQNDHDEHTARHGLIAQAVLETAVARGNERIVQTCIIAYAGHIRTPPYAMLLREIVLAAARLRPLASQRATDKLRNAVFSGARKGLRDIPDVGAAIKGQCGEDYRSLAVWMEFVRALIPRQAPDLSHLWLVDIHQHLLDSAEDTENSPGAQRLTYYKAKNALLRARLVDAADFDFFLGAVRQNAPFIGAEWCRADFYVDLFRWSFSALELRWTDVLQGEDAIDGRFLCATLFTAYERLRTCASEDDIWVIRGDFNKVMLRHVYWQLPADAGDLIAHAWQTSVALGMPDKQAGTAYGELLLTKTLPVPPTSSAVNTACEVLTTVLQTSPGHGEAVFILALAKANYGAKVEALPDLINSARASDETTLNSAFLAHALALSESDPSRRQGLLLEAVDGYADYVEGRRDQGRNVQRLDSYALDRLRFAFDLAFKGMSGSGGPDVERARRRFRRLTD